MTGEGEETVVMLMPENMAASKNGENKEQLQKRKRKFAQQRIKNVKKRIKKWLHSLPDKILENNSELDNNQRKMKLLTQEYILDSYNKKEQYYQIEKIV